ncbi:MAG: tetratricopeptide repeat protein [Casimicrobiaceae bacterium]
MAIAVHSILRLCAIGGVGVHGQSAVTTYLFTDIEGSTRLWEQEPERMRSALARHDELTRAAVEQHRGRVVKTTGDGFHAVFDDPLDALAATLKLQLSLADSEATGGVSLRVRSGLHAGVDERRDNDYFGPVVNRAARIMSSAHGGQILVSQAVVSLISERLPPEVALRDLGRVRLRDLTSSELVYQVMHPKLRQDFPPLCSLEATPNNLPQQVTSFIGRERELAEVKKLLRETRLLTLVGAGGLGKTRLSLQAAAGALDEFQDGVWFVELAALADEQLVPQAVASVLGVKEEAGRPVAEALIRYVRDRRLLIVLDNCEHLVRACADLAKSLLQSGPNTKILTSSRERLRVAGETMYPVSPMSVPDPNTRLSPATLSEYEAARLFISRVMAVQPAFTLNDQNAPAVAQICHRLDGIPLALELAAARSSALSIIAIAERLSERFRLLSRGDQTALPRQQTLRASIDWSHDLLTDSEKTMFRSLAVFAGGWTLDAAEAVGDSGGVPSQDIVDLLTRLVEKSLVALDADARRYRLLDTVREYAFERLAESREGDEVQRRHLNFYLALAERARPELAGPNQGTWLTCLDLERENLLVAHARLERAYEGGSLGLKLVSALRPYWVMRGLLALGHRFTAEALSRIGADERNFARCRGLSDAGQLAYYMGRYREAVAFLEEGLSIAREIGDKGRLKVTLHTLGMASIGQGNLLMARSCIDEALALAHELGNKRDVAAALNARAQLHRMEGNLDAAEPLYEQMLTIARELGDREGTAIGLLNLAMVSVGREVPERANGMLGDALSIAREIGSQPAGQSVLEVCAGLAAQRAQWRDAAVFYGAAEANAADTGFQRDPTDESFLTPLIAKARQGLGETAFAEGQAAGALLTFEDAMLRARLWLDPAS